MFVLRILPGRPSIVLPFAGVRWGARRAPPVAEQASRASGSGRQDASLLCQAKHTPGTATGSRRPTLR